MNKYTKFLVFILFLIIILSLIVTSNKLYNYKIIENYTQMEDNANPFAFAPESDVPDENDKKNNEISEKDNNQTSDNFNKLPFLSSPASINGNQESNEKDKINATKGLLLDEKFAREYPELYEKIVKIVFKDFMNNPEEMQYKLTVSNKSCDNCTATNLITSLSTLDPIQLQKIKVAIEEQGISAGNCDLAYPHPSYAIINNFKELTNCNQNCDKRDKNGSCPPVAFNCLIQDTGIWN